MRFDIVMVLDDDDDDVDVDVRMERKQVLWQWIVVESSFLGWGYCGLYDLLETWRIKRREDTVEILEDVWYIRRDRQNT